MKHIVLIVLSILTSNIITAQSSWLDRFADLERYNFYEKVFITDNLPHNILSNEFQEYYYKKLSEKQYLRRLPVYDTENNRMLINRPSRKAGDGYLHINQKVASEINNTKDEFIVHYFYNGRFIETAKDVRRMVKLHRKQIRLYDINVDIVNKVISVYIYDKKSLGSKRFFDKP